jgi:hypothetical protein
MKALRGCLMLIGLAVLAMITSCALGISGMRKVGDPTRFSRAVDESPEKTRRMVRDYLELAENELPEDRGLDALATRVAVQDYSDNSIHLTLSRDRTRLMEVVATFKPIGDDGTLVEVFTDAKALGQAVRPRVKPAALHRETRRELDRALGAIDAHRVLPGGFSFKRLMAGVRDRRWSDW